MMDAIFRAILKELMVMYPQLAWAAILEQIKGLGPGAHEHFEAWWMAEMGDAHFPGMDGQPNTGQPFDPNNIMP